MSLRYLFLMALVSACGGDMGDPPEPDLGFAGLWGASIFVATAPFDPSPFVYDRTINVSVSGYAVEVNGLCQSGGAILRATGSGRYAEWDGAAMCFPAQRPECADGTLLFRRMTFTLAPDFLEGQGSGIAYGCGHDREVVLTFTASPATPKG